MALLTLFFSAFTSATLLPGSSEALFLLMLSQGSWSAGMLIIIAGAGNSLGGMSNWILGLLIRKGLYKSKRHNINGKYYTAAENWFNKFGSPALLFSFLPIIGDPLCFVAGFIKIHWFKAMIFISLGKFMRYFALSYVV
ncbi:MAG: DedA family protein [gamma proteobacterium symbiont of Taylorina sp.]|nr:DedA family protein [gamma proteobacterium symbiont of Taylorina sp.]